jgi:hypothetical protein
VERFERHLRAGLANGLRTNSTHGAACWCTQVQQRVRRLTSTNKSASGTRCQAGICSTRMLQQPLASLQPHCHTAPCRLPFPAHKLHPNSIAAS